MEPLNLTPINQPAENWAVFDNKNPKHKIVLSLLYQMQWVTPSQKHGEVPDLDRLSKFFTELRRLRQLLERRLLERVQLSTKGEGLRHVPGALRRVRRAPAQRRRSLDQWHGSAAGMPSLAWFVGLACLAILGVLAYPRGAHAPRYPSRGSVRRSARHRRRPRPSRRAMRRSPGRRRSAPSSTTRRPGRPCGPRRSR